MGKRKQDKWRDDSFDAKRRRPRPCHVGETSRANDGTSQEGLGDVIRDAVVEIKDAILVKEETKKEIDELKEKGRKYEEEIGILKEGHEDLKETIRALQDQLRILKEGQEDHKSQIQEMQKRKFAEVDACPSQGSQPSGSPEFNLQIENVMCSTMYKREPVTTVDGSGQIKIAMYYGNKPIRSDHSLASVKVKLVVLNGSFGEQESWSREDFAENIIKGRDGKSLLKHDTFCLIDGRCDYKGAIIMDNSQQKEFKLGVRVIGRTELRVLEGVSNPFKVQEGKTKEKEKRVPKGVSNPSKVQERNTKVIVSKRKHKRPSPAVTTPNLEQPTSTHAIQDDRGKHTEYPTDDTGEDNGASYRPATMQQMVEGNGQANANGQRSSQQIPTQTFRVPAYSMQHSQGPANSDEQQIQHSLQKEVLLPQNIPDQGQHTGFPTVYTGEDNRASYPPATMQQMVEGNGQTQNGNGQNYRHCILDQFLGHSTSVHPMQHGQVHSSPPPNDLQAAAGPYLSAPGQDQYTNFPFGSSELAHQNYSAHASCHYTQDTSESAWLNDFQLDPIRGHKTFVGETYGSFTWRRVLLQWDNPHVELKKHWNFFDQIMPLYSTKSRFYTESFPSVNLMDKAHKLLASISSGDSVSKMITGGRQTPQRRGVLIRLIGPYDSDDGPPVKKQRNAKYQLRFVNRVRSDYYTQEQIKSEDGTFLKVALYDENNLVVTSGPLSSASVEVVVLHGDFSAEGQDYWRSEEFSTCLVHPQSAKEPPALGGDGVLALTDGEAHLENVNFRISSFHARTGKFKMGVVIKNVREDSVEQGITSPFLVRVRLGEEPSRHRSTSLDSLLRVRAKLPNQVSRVLEREPSRHRSTSLDSLLRVRVKLPNQVSGVLERDGKKKAGSSSTLHDKSSQVISILGALMASDRPPEASSRVMNVLGAGSSTASDPPPEPPWQAIRSQLPEAVGYFVASDELLEPSHAPCDYSTCTLCGEGLGTGKDIYMCRGEVAFCSPECREEYILLMEDDNGSRAPPPPSPSLVTTSWDPMPHRRHRHGQHQHGQHGQSSQTACATQQEPYVASSAALRMDTQKMGQVGRK